MLVTSLFRAIFFVAKIEEIKTISIVWRLVCSSAPKVSRDKLIARV